MVLCSSVALSGPRLFWPRRAADPRYPDKLTGFVPRVSVSVATKFLVIFKQISSLSHYKERKEKTCLNCNAHLYGRYCHNCGQENIEPKETFWGLITHFLYDITHFDGKFFNTLKHLIIKPGFLSREYINGRRATYLHPIRMYVFTSAFFFIIFFFYRTI